MILSFNYDSIRALSCCRILQSETAYTEHCGVQQQHEVQNFGGKQIAGETDVVVRWYEDGGFLDFLFLFWSASYIQDGQWQSLCRYFFQHVDESGWQLTLITPPSMPTKIVAVMLNHHKFHGKVIRIHIYIYMKSCVKSINVVDTNVWCIVHII